MQRCTCEPLDECRAHGTWIEVPSGYAVGEFYDALAVLDEEFTGARVFPDGHWFVRARARLRKAVRP